MILDTTVLIDLLRGDQDAVETVRQLEGDGRVLWIPSPAIFELFEGIERSDRPREERNLVEDVLGAYTLLAFEPSHARQAGLISGRLVRRGEMLDPIDAQIAGMAKAEDHPILTRNRKHFERVSGVEIEAY